MDTIPPFEANADPARNLLSTHYRGRVTPEALKAAMAGLSAKVDTLKPGFTALADMSELESMDIECGALLAKAMDLFRKRGVGKVVRVIPDPSKDIGVNILSIVHYRGKVPIATVETLAEAEKELLRK